MLEQVAAARVVERPEAQRVHERDRAGPHGEDVADDPAHAGRGSLVGLDRRRVVVALDPHRDGQPVTDVDDARALAGADEHPRGLGREAAQVHLRGLVGAVLGPHHAEHGQLEVRRVAAQQLDDGLELVVGEAERPVPGLGAHHCPSLLGFDFAK